MGSRGVWVKLIHYEELVQQRWENRRVPVTLAQLTERLLASYDHAGGINHVDGKNLPSKRCR